MLIKQIKLNNIPFKQEPTAVSDSVASNTVAESSNDTFIKENKKPPVIENWQLELGIISDEQIKQINKSRMLPENACLIWVPAGQNKGSYREDSYYKIVLVSSGTKNPKRILPENYMVIKTSLGKIKAVKVKEN